MAEAQKPGSKKITDVAQPGQTAPSGNSKSIIVNNRPLLRDPMVVDETAEDDTQDKPPKSADKSKPGPSLQVAVDNADDKTDTNEADAAVVAETAGAKPADTTPGAPIARDSLTESKIAADEPADKPSVAEPAAEAKSEEPDKPETKSTGDEPAEAEPTEEKAASAAKNQEQVKAAAAEESRHQAAIDKLIDSKQYYLPINTIEKRRSRRFVGLGILLSLLLMIAWADIALDAGLIHLGAIKSVTHFFSN